MRWCELLKKFKAFSPQWMNLTHDLRSLCEHRLKGKWRGRKNSPLADLPSWRPTPFSKPLGNQRTDHTQNQGAGDRQSPNTTKKRKFKISGQLSNAQTPEPWRQTIDQHLSQKYHQDPFDHRVPVHVIGVSNFIAYVTCHLGESPWAPTWDQHPKR